MTEHNFYGSCWLALGVAAVFLEAKALQETRHHPATLSAHLRPHTGNPMGRVLLVAGLVWAAHHFWHPEQPVTKGHRGGAG